MLILASSSPRRRELLRNAGIDVTVKPADVPEDHCPGESPREFAERLALAKAQAVAKDHPHDFVLGADTIVVVDDEIFGKPRDAADAARMLTRLSGREHEVLTAVCLIAPAGKVMTESEVAKVAFGGMSAKEIAGYVANGEPMDKAGAYAAQGIASRWVYRVEGDYLTVVGLPIARVWEMLKRAGYPPK